MSWSAYISDQLEGSGHVTRAAIAGLDGQTWAASEGFTVSPTEVKGLVAAFTNPDAMRAGGMHVGDIKFIFLSGTEEVLRGKKGKQGVHVAKTNTCVIVAIYEEPIQAQQCATTVENLADYLKGCNF